MCKELDRNDQFLIKHHHEKCQNPIKLKTHSLLNTHTHTHSLLNTHTLLHTHTHTHTHFFLSVSLIVLQGAASPHIPTSLTDISLSLGQNATLSMSPSNHATLPHCRGRYGYRMERRRRRNVWCACVW